MRVQIERARETEQQKNKNKERDKKILQSQIEKNSAQMERNVNSAERSGDTSIGAYVRTNLYAFYNSLTCFNIHL